MIDQLQKVPTPELPIPELLNTGHRTNEVSIMRTVLLGTLALVVITGLASCKKSPQSPKKPGAEPSATTTKGMADDTGARARPSTAPANAAAACKKDAARPGKTFSSKEYAVTVTTTSEGGVGKATEAVILVAPNGGYKINMKYDHELILKTMSSGIKPERKTYENKHAAARDKAGLKFVVKYTPSTAGLKVVQGVLDFSVCTPKLCVNKDDLCVSWETTVK